MRAHNRVMRSERHTQSQRTSSMIYFSIFVESFDAIINEQHHHHHYHHFRLFVVHLRIGVAQPKRFIRNLLMNRKMEMTMIIIIALIAIYVSNRNGRQGKTDREAKREREYGVTAFPS